MDNNGVEKVTEKATTEANGSAGAHASSSEPIAHAAIPPKTTKFWQMVLLYPTFAVALLGAIPTYFELVSSWDKGVEFGESKKAIIQNELWRKNIDCSTAPIDPLTTKTLVEVDATICESGDVLIRITAPGNINFFEWVSLEQILNKKPLSQIIVNNITLPLNIIGKAHASKLDNVPVLNQYQPMVLCQVWIDQVFLRRRVSVPGRGCFDEIVNTYTGQVVQITPAPCNCY